MIGSVLELPVLEVCLFLVLICWLEKMGKVLQLNVKVEKVNKEELESFSKGFGADAWVGVRFDGKKWAFLKPSQLGRSKGLENYYFDKELVASYGISFESLIG